MRPKLEQGMHLLEMPPIGTGNEFARYKPATGTSDIKWGDSSLYNAYPSYAAGDSSLDGNIGGSGMNLTSSWLHGTDFSAGDLFTSTNNRASSDNNFANLDQIKIGDQTMENVLKALDPNSGSSNNLNSLNLDSSFNTNDRFSKKYSSAFDNEQAFNRSRFTSSNSNNNNNNRANIIKSHTNTNKPVSFKEPNFFSSPDESFVNMTLPALDTSLLFSEKPPATRNSRQVPDFNYSRNKPAAVSSEREKEQFVAFAVQQYRMLAAMNPEMMRAPENIEELADRDSFKYWGKLFVEERERQARIVLNMQKALTEALSSSAARGPNVMAHLGAATGDFELETIGRYADQCRKRSQMISSYFNTKK